MRSYRRSVLILQQLLLTLLILRAACGLPAVAACSREKIAELPVTMQGVRPMVTVQVNGTDVPFIVDTGADKTMISPQVAVQVHLDVGQRARKSPLLATNGGRWVEVADAMVDLAVPGLLAHNKHIDIGEMGTTGLLAQDFLRIADVNDFLVLGDVEYDLAHGVIRLWRTRDCGGHQLAYWAQGADQGTVSAINTDIETEGPASRRAARNPYTIGEARVNGRLAVALFDTGSPFSTLSVHLATRAGIGPGSPGVVPDGQGSAAGGQPSWIAPVSSFKLGKEEIKNTRMRVSEVFIHNREMARTDMTLGVDFFLAHRIYIGSNEGELYFTANGGTGEVFNVGTADPGRAN